MSIRSDADITGTRRQLKILFRAEREILWDWISLISHPRNKFYYYGDGTDVKIGDVVACEAGSDAPFTNMRLGVVAAFLDPEDFSDKNPAGSESRVAVNIKFDVGDGGMLIDPYDGPDGTHSPDWEDVYFVRRGTPPGDGYHLPEFTPRGNAENAITEDLKGQYIAKGRSKKDPDGKYFLYFLIGENRVLACPLDGNENLYASATSKNFSQLIISADGSWKIVE